MDGFYCPLCMGFFVTRKALGRHTEYSMHALILSKETYVCKPRRRPREPPLLVD
jgi:hypothetical protein